MKGMKRRCTVGSGYIVVHGRNAHVCTRPGGTLSHWKLLFTFSHLSRRRIGLQSEKILYYSLYLIENWEIIGVIFPLLALSGKIILFPLVEKDRANNNNGKIILLRPLDDGTINQIK